MRNSTLLKAKTRAAAAVFAAAMTVSGAAPAIVSAPVIAQSAAAVVGDFGLQDETGINKGTITVNGVSETGVTVTAYKIVTGYYKDQKLVKYVLMDKTNGKVASIGNQEKGQTKDDDPNNDVNDRNDIITEAELTTIAKNISSKAFTADAGTKLTKQADGSYTGEFTPGLYVILVSSPENSTKVYNPAVAAVNVTDVNAGTVEGGSVDFRNYFTTTDGTTPSIVYVKTTESTFNKKETSTTKLAAEAEEDTKKTGANALNFNVKNASGKGDTVAFGDTIYFQIENMTVPSFSDEYTNPYYYVTDKLTPADAFTDITNIVVKDNAGNILEAGDSKDYKLTMDSNKKGFTVELTSTYLTKHKADTTRPVLTITYQTKLTGKADVNFAENQNHAELHFSNSPVSDKGKGTGEHKEHKDTYIYTFTIDGNLDAQDSSKNEETHEFNKVTKADPMNYEAGKATGESAGTKDVTTSKSKVPLEGATFTLYSDEACTKPIKARSVNQTTGEVTLGTSNYESTSDTNGHFSFAGLDDGTYYVKETKAPVKNGVSYTLSDAVYKFVIASELNEDGTLKTYSITTSYKSVAGGVKDWAAAGKATYTASAAVDATTGAVTNTQIMKDVTPMEVVDAKIQTLPFTGGEGRYLMWGISGTLACACIVFVVMKKKDEKSNS